MPLTQLEFRNRFTPTEKVTIELASMDNPAASMPERQAAAALRVYLADVAAATFIDVTRPDTMAGVQALEAYGIIGTGRAAEILQLPPSDWPPVGGYAVGDFVRVLPPFDGAYPGVQVVEGFGPEAVVLEGGASFSPTYLERA